MRGQSEAILQTCRHVQPKTLMSAEAKKLAIWLYLTKTTFNSLNDIATIVYSIYSQIATYDWLCHLATFLYQNYYKGGQVTKPIICS